jgi:hypothetical protein
MFASPRGRLASSARPGFTLFEVSISLLIISVTVVSVLLVFPAGLRQIQNARYKMYASTMACQLIDEFSQPFIFDRHGDIEAPYPWDIGSDRRPTAPDLETQLSNGRFGLLPVPLQVARRLDSDNDEIQKILDQGGYIYYVPGNFAGGWSENLMTSSPPNDLKKIIIGVVGNAQHNASPFCAYKRWPYYMSVPCPPMAFAHSPTYDFSGPVGAGSTANLGVTGGYYCWQSAMDKDIKNVFSEAANYYEITATNPVDVTATGSNKEKVGGNVGSVAASPSTSPVDVNKIKDNLGKFIDATLVYAGIALENSASSEFEKLFVRVPVSNDISSLLKTGLGPSFLASLPSNVPADIAKSARKVLALNYVASALMSLTRWHKYSGTNTWGTTVTPFSPLGGAGFSLKSEYTAVKSNLISSNITHDKIIAFVENVRYIYYYFTSAHPYNWAVPRPYEHATMMDYPLLEKDMGPYFSDLTMGISEKIMNGSIFRAPVPAAATQWRYAVPQLLTTMSGDPTAATGISPGPNSSYPNLYSSPTGGDWKGWFVNDMSSLSNRYTLAKPFRASERCRQLVMWAVDWQDYEDFETAPSAPVDAAHSHKMAPSSASTSWNTMMMDDVGWRTATNLNCFQYRLNPEYSLSFATLYDENGLPLPSGSQMTLSVKDDRSRLRMTDATGVIVYGLGDPSAPVPNAPTKWLSDGVKLTTNGDIQNGCLGADRNGNKSLDRGRVSPSVRMRASTVARFNFYDPRIPASVR